jgi:hypothetical protein
MRLVTDSLKRLLILATATLLGCATVTTVTPHKLNAELLTQPDPDRVVVIGKGKGPIEQLYRDCEFRLALRAKELGLAGFYVIDRAEQALSDTHTAYPGTDDTSVKTDIVFVERVTAVFKDDPTLNLGKYCSTQDLVDQYNALTETRTVTGGQQMATGIVLIAAVALLVVVAGAAAKKDTTTSSY